MSRAAAVADALHALHQGIVVPSYEELLWRRYTQVISAGETVFDIGAHSGFHTAHLLDAVGASGRVVAFEPLPHLAQQLRLEFSQRNVEVHQLALGSTREVCKFYFPRDKPGFSGLKVRLDNADAAADCLSVEKRTLDDFSAYNRVSYVKIDVEGGEVDCLTGGQRFFALHRPIVSVEYGSPSYTPYGHTKRSLFDAARRIDYVPADLFGNVMRELAEWEYVCDRATWDYFLVPSERAQGDTFGFSPFAKALDI